MQLLTSQKKILGPVHLHPKTDKWDYLRSPIMKKKIVSCFDIGEVPRSPGKWNWNWLYFLPFIFTFEQGVRCITHCKATQAHLKRLYCKVYTLYSKLLVPVIFFAELVQTGLWAVWVEPQAPHTRFLPRSDR